MYKILIATAKKKLYTKLEKCLNTDEYELLTAVNKEETIDLFFSAKPSAIIVDAELDGDAGPALCRQLRAESGVILMLVVKKTQREIALASLEDSCDDYLSLPLQQRETLARIKAALRRVPKPEEVPQMRSLAVDNLTIDMDQKTVVAFGKEVNLTLKELELLWILAVNPNQVFSRALLLQQVWGKEPREDMRTVDTHIKKLRHKLNVPADSLWEIATVWSVGYKFSLEQESSVL